MEHFNVPRMPEIKFNVITDIALDIFYLIISIQITLNLESRPTTSKPAHRAGLALNAMPPHFSYQIKSINQQPSRQGRPLPDWHGWGHYWFSCQEKCFFRKFANWKIFVPYSAFGIISKHFRISCWKRSGGNVDYFFSFGGIVNLQ